MAEPPDTIAEMHEQDWLLVIQALTHFSSPVDPHSGATRDLGPTAPRATLAFELGSMIADHIGISEDKLNVCIDFDWDGSER